MAKQGISFASLRSMLVGRANSSGWTLCIGAGTSYPMFPSWNELVQKLAERDIPEDVARDILPKLREGFGLDALLQASRDRLKMSTEEFAQVISTEFYAEMKHRIGTKGWRILNRGLAAFHPGDMTPAMWKGFDGIMTSNFPQVSALEIASAVVESSTAGLAPAAILSFNAEPLLYALINARTSRTSPKNTKAPLDRITRSVSNRSADRIPYVFCHGLLPIDGHTSSGWHSLDKLVFSESEYLQVANSGFSWQSSIFIDSCMSRSVVFVGLSFSDPNLRRWLGILHQNRLRELETIGRGSHDSAPHYWIRKTEKSWTEAAVAHLGVRLIWLDEWNQVGLALRKMLGLS